MKNILRLIDYKKNIIIKSIVCKFVKIFCLVMMKCNLFELNDFIVVKFCRLRRFKSYFDNSEKKLNRKVRNVVII